jgi:AbrB family looped-hinge helix DNA binding protein
MSEEVIIGRRYTMVIPKSIRKKMGLKEGQKVFVREQGGKILIEPLPTDPYKTLAAVLGDFTYVEEKHEKVAEGWLKKVARSRH